jgi:leucyl aminopeptidase
VPARLLYLSYHGSRNDDQGLTIVGKGLMYDTGGYSLKQNMNDMKDDMGGAATAISVFEAAVLNKLPVNLNVVVAATDNRINSKALLPDDVLTAMNGKTIEIVSTDAEGRLTLADALCFAQKEGAKVVVDIATLTGAVVVALGEYTTGLFANDQDLAEKMLKSAESENESLWQLPITDYIRKQVRGSKVADLTNSTGRNMGASSAAAFLEEFVEPTTKWLHIDIAGTVFHTSPAFEEFYGASGVMVRTLLNFLANYKN